MFGWANHILLSGGTSKISFFVASARTRTRNKKPLPRATGVGNISDLNRWTQPDTIIPDGNPQSLNRYSYGLNNPVKYNDPTGHFFGIDDALEIVGLPLLVAAAVVVVVAYYSSPQVRQSIDQMGQYLANQTEADRQANAHKREIAYINSQSGQTADSGNLSPRGSMGKWCLKNKVECATAIIVTGVLSVTALVCSADGELCKTNDDQNQENFPPTLTPTPTSASVPPGAKGENQTTGQSINPSPSSQSINPSPSTEPDYNPYNDRYRLRVE